jgi:hypothetical protein
LLDTIPEQTANSDWTERWSAELAFSRCKVADDLGDAAQADKWIEKAAEHYASIYPADHYDRRKFNAYRAARPGT